MLHLSFGTYVRLSKRRPLSKSNTFDPNFIKLGHNVKYHNVLWSISHHAFSIYGPLFMNIHHLKQCLLSKSNTFDQNFRKLGHNVKYHNVLWSIWHHAFSIYGPLFMNIHHLKQCLLSKSNTFDQNFRNLVTLFSTMMSSSNSIMVHITPCFQ